MKKTIAWVWVLFGIAVAGCAGPGDRSTGQKPRLVVLLVVDGLPQRQVVDYRDQLAPDGLRRFLDRGTWFANAHYGYTHTVTAAGHATLLTGAYPHRTGIISNEWRDPATNELEYCTGDTAHTYIGHKTNKLDGTSPKNLKAESLGDVMKRLDPRAKVIAVSGKDRGAILPAGKAGVAYMYQTQTGQFASSTFYMPAHPAWVDAFHAQKPADRYFGRAWKPLLADTAYGNSLPDEQKWYAKGGKLPKTMGEGMDKPGPLFYGQLVPSPFSDELTLDFARAAIAGEALGADDATDLLAVSLSAHDYVNHAYGAESRLSHDHLLHVDRALEAFFKHLDATIGTGRYVAVLTADHGFMPNPDHSLALGRDAGRQSGSQTLAKVNGELALAFGEGRYAVAMSAHGMVLDRKAIAARGQDIAKVSEAARQVLLKEKGVEAVYTRAELESGSRAGAPHFDRMRKSWHRELSADLQVVLKPYWMYTSTSSATTHGSPHPYDTHVPILFYGAGVAAGRRDEPVEVADIAPTLARVLGIPAPAQSEGRVLAVGAPAR